MNRFFYIFSPDPSLSFTLQNWKLPLVTNREDAGYEFLILKVFQNQNLVINVPSQFNQRNWEHLSRTSFSTRTRLPAGRIAVEWGRICAK